MHDPAPLPARHVAAAAAVLLAAVTMAACASGPRLASGPGPAVASSPASTPGPAGTSGLPSASGAEPPPSVPFPPVADFAPTTLYVARRRWHVDVGFAAESLRQPLAGILRTLPGARYAFFGFGDRRYLLAKHRGAPVLLAALWPGPALLLVTGLDNSPDQAFGQAHVIELPMTAEQSRAVQDFIWRSLSQGTPVPYAHGPYEGSAYFAADARYSALHTCITWAAEALRAGGFPVRSRLTLVAGQLWRQILKLRASIAGRRIAALAHHGRATALGDHDGRLRGRWRTRAADATG